MNALKLLPCPVLNHSRATALLENYARPNDKISELIAQQKLLPLKRGLYAVANAPSLSPSLVANHLYGPSYLSAHWALAFYGFLSERVAVITSMTIDHSRQFATPLGIFHYHHLPAPYYSIGITNIQQSAGSFMIAKPEKALADVLVSTRKLRIQSAHAMLSYLENDLRLDREDLVTLDASQFMRYAERGYKAGLLRHLSTTIRNLQDD